MKDSLPRLILFIVVLITSSVSFAQKNAKPKVFIYGSTMASYAAAVQCAQSDVPVVWALESDQMIANINESSFSVNQLENLSSGIWMDLLMLIAKQEQPKDSIAEIVNKNITAQIFKNALQDLIVKQKNLQVISNAPVKQLVKSKKGWNVTLQNKQKYEVIAAFDGSINQSLNTFTNANHASKTIAFTSIDQLTINELRTVVASGAIQDSIYGVTFNNLLENQFEGFYSMKSFQDVSNTLYELPFLSNLGQAIGATMAYTAFFKVAEEKINLRLLQGELLKFRSRLLPYQDIMMEDPNYINIQRFGLSGIFSGELKNGHYQFVTNKEVGVQEVKSPILQYFSRAQLWFKDEKDEHFHTEPFFNLIKLLSFKDANDLSSRDHQLEKDQKSLLSTNVEQSINRYDFAVAFDIYCKPFDLGIDFKGIIRR